MKEGEACKPDIYIRVERSGDFEQVDALLDAAGIALVASLYLDRPLRRKNYWIAGGTR